MNPMPTTVSEVLLAQNWALPPTAIRFVKTDPKIVGTAQVYSAKYI